MRFKHIVYQFKIQIMPQKSPNIYAGARGVNKDSVGGGKYFECGARSAAKFFYPPFLEFCLPTPRKIS